MYMGTFCGDLGDGRDCHISHRPKRKVRTVENEQMDKGGPDISVS